MPSFAEITTVRYYTPVRWLLLIYSVPAEPSRKRAWVWREIRRAGAVYLRDGVCVLPQTETNESAFDALAQRIVEFEGRATVVEEAVLDAAAVEEVTAHMRAARADEYAAVREDTHAFLEHLRREQAHRDLSPAELKELGADLTKVQRWYGKVRRRDHLNAGGHEGIDELLLGCEEALSRLIDASARGAAPR